MNNCTPHFDECHCHCHDGIGKVYHFMACCNVCSYCGMNVVIYCFDRHMEEHKDRGDEDHGTGRLPLDFLQ